jgi:hypothetical protein
MNPKAILLNLFLRLFVLTLETHEKAIDDLDLNMFVWPLT